MSGSGRLRVFGQARKYGTITLCLAHVAASMSMGSSTEIRSNSVREPSETPTSDDRVNILMVDDQPGKLLTYEAILSDLGENLIKATSAKEALEKLLKTDVAVVLMDGSMPEGVGFELAEMTRPHPRFQKTAVIFVSAV